MSFDEVGTNVFGSGMMMQTIKGMAVDAGAGAIFGRLRDAYATP